MQLLSDLFDGNAIVRVDEDRSEEISSNACPVLERLFNEL